MIGRHRPVEQDALRVLTVVHQLGEQPSADGAPAGRRWLIDTESHLQHLDHLARHPIDLAYVLLDQIRSRDSELEPGLRALAGRVRRLLDAPRRGHHRPNLLRPFDPGSWQRWDDALALLGCRGLLRVELLPTATEAAAVGATPTAMAPAGDRNGPRRAGPLNDGELRYLVTARGARWLVESVYGRQPSLAPYRERCDLLRNLLPDRLLRPHSRAALSTYLREFSRRLDTFSSDDQIQPEDDLLSRLFQATFSEVL